MNSPMPHRLCLKTFLLVFAALAIAGTALAEDVKLHLVEGNGKKTLQHKATTGGVTIMRLSVANLAAHPITVTHVGAGSGAFLAQVEPRTIEPAAEAFFSMLIDNDALGVASNVDLAVGYRIQDQLRIAQSVVTLSASDVMTFTPGFLTWKVGAPAEEKSAKVSLPDRTKIVKALEVSGFTVRVEGDVIFAKPVATDKPVTAGAMFKTAPNMKGNRAVVLGLSVVE